MRAVAAEAGVSLGQVQHYFASKDELLQHACRQVIELSAASFEEHTQSLADYGAVRALVIQPVPRDDQTRAGAAVWQSFLTRSVSDPALRGIIQESIDGVYEELQRLISGAQQAGDLRADLDSRRTAHSLFALSYGLTQAVLLQTLEPADAIASADATLAALRAEPAAMTDVRAGS